MEDRNDNIERENDSNNAQEIQPYQILLQEILVEEEAFGQADADDECVELTGVMIN